MGGCCSLNERISPTIEPKEDPREKIKRTTTDIFFLIFLTTFLTVLLFFIGYCISKGNIYRIINGYDNCGMVCSKNMNHKQFADGFCSKLPDGPYLIVLSDANNTSAKERFCVSNCTKYDGYEKFFNRCIRTKDSNQVNNLLSKTGIRNFFMEVVEDLHFVWPQLCILCLISLVFSIIILLLFRYFAGIVVWLVLIGTIMVALLGTGALWYMQAQSKNTKSNSMSTEERKQKSDVYFSFAVISTIITLLLICIIFAMRKRIKLVVQLFSEAGKAISAMPLLLPQPILTFISLMFIISIWILFCLLIESAGSKTFKEPHYYYYEKDNIIRFTRWYNLMAIFWMIQFTIGCQHVVISGAISNWYFTRNKNQLKSPIFKSFYNLFRYHMGSVALGSLIISIVQFVRIIFRIIQKYLSKHSETSIVIRIIMKCCNACLYCFEEVIKFLSRNAYIEVAMNGYSFCKGGKQAFKLLTSNALRVAAINSVGDFVLFLGKVFVVIATVLVGLKLFQNTNGINHVWVPITLSGLFAYFIANCFLDIYEMAIDTIFLCFCQDCEENDGLSRPYYMSRDLMDFVENSKKALDAQYEFKRETNAWHQESVSTISNKLEQNKAV